MALQSSGNSISFQNIIDEFGENDTKSMGEYRVSQTVGGLLNQPLDTGIPQSGPIKFSEFYSKRLNVVIDYHSGSQENRPNDAMTKYDQAADEGTVGTSDGNWTVIGGFRNPPTNTSGTKSRIHVNKTIGSSKSSINHCAVRTGSDWESGTVLTVEVGPSGKIYGAGGNGGEGGTGESEGAGNGKRNGEAGSDGSSALGIQYSGTSIINNGEITAGYGGGGGGGYRKVEREEWFSGPVYQAGGGGGGGGQGLPSGLGGAGASGVNTFEEETFSGLDNSDPPQSNATASNKVTVDPMSEISSIDNFKNNPDSDRTAGTYNIGASDYTAQGSGSDATFTVVVSGTGNANVSIVNGGKGYAVNNTITIPNSNLGNGTDENGDPAADLKFDVAGISSTYTFRRNGTNIGTNNDGNPITVGTVGAVGTKRYFRVTSDPDDGEDPAETGQPVPQTDNAPNNQIWAIREFTVVQGSSSPTVATNGTATAGGNGGDGAESSQSHGGGGGGGGSNGTGGEGGMSSGENDGANGTTSSGGAGELGRHTGGIEGENNVQGQGGSGGVSGAAIRRTSGITVTISNAANSASFGSGAQTGEIDGSQTATGVS